MLGRRCHEAAVFLFFLLVSFGFWVLQTLNETFEVEIRVPVRLLGVPKSVLITTELPPWVSVTVRDRGTSLIRYYRDSGLRPVDVDFAKYDNGASAARVQVAPGEVARAIQAQLDPTTRVQSVRPDTLEFYYNRGLSRRLPAAACGTLTASPQHYLQAVTCSPDSVTVYAPASVLDTMGAAYTRALNLPSLKETRTLRAGLRPMRGVKYEPAAVEVTALVGYYTEKSVEVPVIGLNFPGDKELRTFPSRVRITFRVGSDRYQRVTADNFVLAITYEELLDDPSPKHRLRLKSLPEGVSNVRISPQEVDYLIERADTEEDTPE